MITAVENVLEENDLNVFRSIFFNSLSINEINRESLIYKEEMIAGVADLLKKMLIQSNIISNQSKLDIINLLDKLNTQKERLEMIKSAISSTDIEKAGKKLSKKSQSAFELK